MFGVTIFQAGLKDTLGEYESLLGMTGGTESVWSWRRKTEN